MEKVEDKKKWFVIKSFCKSMWLITDNLKTFFVQGLVFSLILTIMSYVITIRSVLELFAIRNEKTFFSSLVILYPLIAITAIPFLAFD